ncbi:MAG: hypothetical protein CMH81_05610 [Nitrospiraceae bacterium]|nr:hypothetical protein [Nitrospiraceae bacterium]
MKASLYIANWGKVARVVTIVLCVLIIGVVCLHSLEEIHYLKSFYPSMFSVEETFYASGVEFFKVLIISLPLYVIIRICLAFLGRSRKAR